LYSKYASKEQQMEHERSHKEMAEKLKRELAILEEEEKLANEEVHPLP